MLNSAVPFSCGSEWIVQKAIYSLIAIGKKGLQNKRSQMMILHHKQGRDNYLNEGHALSDLQRNLTQRCMECGVVRSKTDGSQQVYHLIYTFKRKEKWQIRKLKTVTSMRTRVLCPNSGCESILDPESTG